MSTEKRCNLKSDLQLSETFYEFSGSQLVKTAIPDDAIDFELTYFVEPQHRISVGRRNGEYYNCKKVDENTLVAFLPLSRHSLGAGKLWRELHMSVPNNDFEEGIRKICVPADTNHFLWDGPTDNSVVLNSEVIVATILKGNTGDSAYQSAVKAGFKGTEIEYAMAPVTAAETANTATQTVLEAKKQITDALETLQALRPDSPVINLNHLLVDGTESFTLETAIQRLHGIVEKTGKHVPLPGSVLIYRGLDEWEAAQFLGTQPDTWTEPQQWTAISVPGDAAIAVIRPETFGAVADGRTDCTEALQAAIDTAYQQKAAVELSSGTYLITRAIYVYDGLVVRGQGIYNTIIRTPFRKKAKYFPQGSPDRVAAQVAESYVVRDKKPYMTRTAPESSPALDLENGHNRFYLGDGCVGYYDGDRDTNPKHPLYYPNPGGSGTKKKKWDAWFAERKKIQDTGRWVGRTGRENYAFGAIKSSQYPGLVHTTDPQSPDYIPERCGSTMHTGIRHVTLRDFQLQTNSSDRGSDSGINFKYSASQIPASRREELDSSCLGITLESLYLFSIGGSGFSVTRNVQCSIRNVTARQCADYGFLIDGVTSTTFYACYANGCTQGGYRLKGVNYSSLISCAADSCAVAYNLSGCNGVSLLSCGAERCKLEATEDNVEHGTELTYKGRSYVIRECRGVSLVSCYAFTLAAKAALDIEEVSPEDVAARLNENRHVYIASSKDVIVSEGAFKSLRRIRTAPFRNTAGEKCNASGGTYDPEQPGSRYWQMQNFLAGAIFEITGEGNAISIYSDLNADALASFSEIRDGNLDLYDPGTVPHPDGHNTAHKTLKGLDGNGGWTYQDSTGKWHPVHAELLEVQYPVTANNTRYWAWRASLQLIRVQDYSSNGLVKQQGFVSVIGKPPVSWSSVTAEQMKLFTIDVVAHRSDTTFIDGNKSAFTSGRLFDPEGLVIPIVSGITAERKLYNWGVRNYLNSQSADDRSGRKAAYTIWGNSLYENDTSQTVSDPILELVARCKNSQMTSMPFAIHDSIGTILFGIEGCQSDTLICRGEGTSKKSYLSKSSSARTSGGFLPEEYTAYQLRAVVNALVESMQQHGLIEGVLIFDCAPSISQPGTEGSQLGNLNVSIDYRCRKWEGETLTISEWGVVYAKSNKMPTVDGSTKVKCGAATLSSKSGSIQGTIPAPSAGTYYMRVYIKNNGATSYSPVVAVQVEATTL